MSEHIEVYQRPPRPNKQSCVYSKNKEALEHCKHAQTPKYTSNQTTCPNSHRQSSIDATTAAPVDATAASVDATAAATR